MGIVCPLKEVRIGGLDTFQALEGLGKPWAVHLMGEEGRVPQSCSLTLRNRNPNQIVRLHFMHQNWPKGVIEPSFWDMEYSNSSKYHKYALILVIFSNICPTKRLPWTLTEWVCVPEVEINDCTAYYMFFVQFPTQKSQKHRFYRKNEILTVFFYEISQS